MASMKKLLTFAIIATCGTYSLTAHAATIDERLAAGEIIVSTRDVGAQLPEATVQAVVDAPPAAVWKIIDDCANYKRNMPRIAESKQLSRNGNVAICEVTVDMPMPLSNLTSVTEATATVGPPMWKRAWKFIRGTYKRNEGSWTLSAFDPEGKRTRVVYKVLAVPDMSVPNFMIRRAQEGAFPDLLKRLRVASGAK